MDAVARMGGDEFFVLALHIGTPEQACALAQKLLAHIKPIPGLHASNHLDASIGICLFPYPGMSVSDLIHRADEAMYQVKNSGKGNYKLIDAAQEIP